MRGERFWRNGVIQATKKGVIGAQFALPRWISIVPAAILIT